MMEYLWALYVVTALGTGDIKYTRVSDVLYESRMKCEIEASIFTAYHEPWADNETVWCIKVDE
jgi:hypothetical protein